MDKIIVNGNKSKRLYELAKKLLDLSIKQIKCIINFNKEISIKIILITRKKFIKSLDENFKIGTIQERLNNNCDPYDNSDITLDFVENMSLMNANNSKCFSCKYIKYCQGLCPRIRKNITENIDRNIYKNNECKKIIKKRIQQLISKLEV